MYGFSLRIYNFQQFRNGTEQDVLIERQSLLTHTHSVALVRERTIPTERPPPVDEVSANFCG